MKKMFLSALIIFGLVAISASAFHSSQNLEDKLTLFTNKLDTLISAKGENFKQRLLMATGIYKEKYKDSPNQIYKLNYVENHLSNIPQKPNILLIIADDMGLDASPWYPEYTGQKPKTPNLDALAKNGLVFENVWSNPLCSPTRASILTGKYGFQTGVLGALSKSDTGIKTNEYSLQKLVTEKSPYAYNQAVIGKWHLATDNNGGNDNPKLMGVPHYSGHIGGTMKDYYNWKKVSNGQTSMVNNYATSEFSDDSIDWLKNNTNNPWFLWLAYTAPHSPFHTPPKDLLSSQTVLNLQGSDVESNPLPYYLSAIEAMDSEIGRVLSSLSKEQRDNTIVIFIGDNGTPGQVVQTPYSNKEAKGSISRGGIHVPMIVSGVGIDSGRISEYVNTSDLYTTIAELSGIDITTFGNSISFAPLLFGQNREVERNYLYAEIQSSNQNGGASPKNGWTIRKDGYQYISLDRGTQKLFADSDRGQTNNLINTYPKIAEEFKNLGEKIREKSIGATYGQYPTNPEDIICYDDSQESSSISQTTNTSTEKQQKKYDIDTRYMGAYSLHSHIYGNSVTVTVDENSRTMQTNALPDHDTGTFPNAGNPNKITAQSESYTFPIKPVYTGKQTPAREPAIMYNGVKIEPETAEVVECESGESYRIEAIQDYLNLGLDHQNAHVQPNGAYHYHGAPKSLIANMSGDDIVHLGYAKDGFPLYYSKKGSFTPSYVIDSQKRSGRNCTYRGKNINISGSQPDGRYVSDWKFDSSVGNLDECNGGYVNGAYGYFMTDEYPYAPRCLKGEFSEEVRGGGGGGNRRGGERR